MTDRNYSWLISHSGSSGEEVISQVDGDRLEVIDGALVISSAEYVIAAFNPSIWLGAEIMSQVSGAPNGVRPLTRGVGLWDK